MLTAIIFGVVVIFAASALASVPREGKSIAVFSWPGAKQSSVIEIIVEADGVIKNFGQFSWVAISNYDKKNRVQRLYKAGALLVLDAALVSTCLNL